MVAIFARRVAKLERVDNRPYSDLQSTRRHIILVAAGGVSGISGTLLQLKIRLAMRMAFAFPPAAHQGSFALQ